MQPDHDETPTDEDRIAYWRGAYERMAARNVELSDQRDQMLEVLKDAERMFHHTFAMDGTVHKSMKTAIAKATGADQ